MACRGRPRPIGVPFSRFRHMKGLGFHESKNMSIKGSGNFLFRYMKGPFIIFQWKVYERGTICQWKV